MSVEIAFDETWASLRFRLSAGATIRNWTAANGVIGEPFTIVTADENAITVDAPGAETLLRVPREDFQRIHAIWADYLALKIRRTALKSLTWYSKYVISILHWFEQTQASTTPRTSFHEIPARWRAGIRRHIHETTGEDRDHLNAMDFQVGRSVRLDFPDGSMAIFRYAFHLEAPELREAAVFTEHCGYHYFPLGGLRIEVLQAIWPKDDEDADDEA